MYLAKFESPVWQLVKAMKFFPFMVLSLSLLIFFLCYVNTPVLAQNLQRNQTSLPRDGSWSFGFGIPVSYSFKKAADNNRLKSSDPPAGIMLHLQSPFFISLGLEYYKVKIENEFDSSGAINRFSSLMIDLEAFLDIAFLFFGLGCGYGYAWIEGDNADLVNPSPSSQILIKSGFKLSDKLKVYLALHNISAQIELKNSDSLLETGGIMISTGLSAGF